MFLIVLDLISQRSAGLPGSSSASYHRSITGGLLSGHIDVPVMPYLDTLNSLDFAGVEPLVKDPSEL